MDPQPGATLSLWLMSVQDYRQSVKYLVRIRVLKNT